MEPAAVSVWIGVLTGAFGVLTLLIGAVIAAYKILWNQVQLSAKMLRECEDRHNKCEIEVALIKERMNAIAVKSEEDARVLAKAVCVADAKVEVVREEVKRLHPEGYRRRDDSEPGVALT